jgi:4-aminobutyrate aminotransferase-like enzyme
MTSRQVLDLLGRYESRNVTFVESDRSWPIVWKRARGVQVEDAEGRKYVDLTAAFGVAAGGHANPRVVRAGQKQMATLLHAMGDVHPHELKAVLARELSRLTFERWTERKPAGGAAKRSAGKTIFCNSGFEAVEAALKTALLATGKPGVIAFHGGYHGLGYGALNATHREHFRAPFVSQLGQFGHFIRFPATQDHLTEVEADLRRAFGRHEIGAILVEPIQARGGINVPPATFLPMLGRLAHEQGALLVADEIYTGFGRTGLWFGCEHSQAIPDLVCVGKALTGGFPLSACVGRAEIMDAAWPASNGEAIHTSTFLGHPVGCAMALAHIAEIQSRRLVAASARLGKSLTNLLRSELKHPRLQMSVRGAGLMVGVELSRSKGPPPTSETIAAIKEMLRRGFILLPEGEFSNVIAWTPPLVISQRQLTKAVQTLKSVIAGL